VNSGSGSSGVDGEDNGEACGGVVGRATERYIALSATAGNALLGGCRSNGAAAPPEAVGCSYALAADVPGGVHCTVFVAHRWPHMHAPGGRR